MRNSIVILFVVCVCNVHAYAQHAVSCAVPDTSRAIVLFTSNGGTTIDAEFSLSETKKVRFARGNLMYQPSTGRWKIADRQFDMVGGKSTKEPAGVHGTIWHINSKNGKRERSTNKVNRNGYEGWLDLFSWGASGWYGSDKSGGEDSTKNCDYRLAHNPHGKVTSNPQEINSNYFFNLGNDPSQGMVGDYANADWGVYHNIELGGTKGNSFRTPTYEEWQYLFFGRENAEKLLALATIRIPGNNGAPDTLINGALLLPNDWESRKPRNFHFKCYSDPSGDGKTYSVGNTYTVDEWNYMEACGAVFLPACGGAASDTGGDKFNRSGYYWIATPVNGKVYDINWGPADPIELKPNTSRWHGRAVRLCQDIVE